MENFIFHSAFFFFHYFLLPLCFVTKKYNKVIVYLTIYYGGYSREKIEDNGYSGGH
jgi:hypothetical protein